MLHSLGTYHGEVILIYPNYKTFDATEGITSIQKKLKELEDRILIRRSLQLHRPSNTVIVYSLEERTASMPDLAM